MQLENHNIEEGERTKKKKRKNKDFSTAKRDMLDNTPKIDKRFNFMISGLSPNNLFDFKNQLEEKPNNFEPFVIQESIPSNSAPLTSPSRMLNLSSPYPEKN